MNQTIPPSPSYGQIVGEAEFFCLDTATSLGEGKLWIQNQLYYDGKWY